MSVALLLALALNGAPGADRATPPAPVGIIDAIEKGPIDDALVDLFDSYAGDPVLFVRDVFGAEPDAWQADALRLAARQPRVAMSACKGPGKSCVLAWTIWWFLATRFDAQVVAVSITADNLRDNLWKELAVWQAKSELLTAAFDLGGERIVSRERPKTWWCSARAFAQSADRNQQANTLAGFHGEHVMVVLDEVGDFPEGVLSAADAIFANDVDAHLVVAGNPTSVSGPLYRICTKDARRWEPIVYITGDPKDPKRSPRISKEWAQEQIDDWGEDNDWVRVNVLGLFPNSSPDSLIGANDVLLAQHRDPPALSYRSDARIWGLDPARYGDDESALARRQGVLARKILHWRGKDGVDLGNIIGQLFLEADKAGELPDAVFVDVGGVGASAFDQLKHLGWEHLLIAVDFGGSAADPRFADKRAEIWWAMAQWLRKMPAALPVDGVLSAELTSGPTFRYAKRGKRTCFVLESKEDMRARGVPSPNRGDALALTFGGPVMPQSREDRALAAYARSQRERLGPPRDGYGGGVVTEYDPFKREEG